MRARLLTVTVFTALACALWAAGAQADVSMPPITTPPPAGSSPPSASGLPNCGDVSDWYLQSDYAGVWPTESTWWEAICPPVGAFNAGGYVVYPTSFHYWDGSRAVHYGTWEEHADYDNGYFACFWSDVATGQYYGPFVCGSGDPAPPPNAYPTASLTVACTGGSCSFDASSSSDSDGTIQAYYWSFGDGSGFFAGGVTTTHNYERSGNYTVTLDIADDDWAWASTSTVVTVELPTVEPPNAAPEASFDSSCSGLVCTFDGRASTDSDGTIASYNWSFGDGAGAVGGSTTTSHTYGQAGTYAVTLTVTDDAGATGKVSESITVTNAAPTARFTISCSELTCDVDATDSFDADGAIPGYRWDFGDGSGGSGRLARHTYPQPRTYTVTLTVTDNAGSSSTHAKTFNPISVSTRGYKANGRQKVDLSWSGADGASFDVVRNGARIATVSATTYTDTVGRGGGAYTYQVCESGSSICSNAATVNF
jgi:PKD repeat protein